MLLYRRPYIIYKPLKKINSMAPSTMACFRFRLILVSLAALRFQDAVSTSFTFQNNCAYTVWPGLIGNANSAPMPNSGFELPQGATQTFEAPSNWAGNMWARTKCATDSSGRFSCITGDCAGQLNCNNVGGTPPKTLAEFTLQGYEGKDFYDISNVDGFNVPVSITPEGVSGCPSVACATNINSLCPRELQEVSNGVVVACKSSCLAFNQDQYCCRGAYNGPKTCKPTNYSKIFKDACPQAYSYAYDDSTSTFTCAGANYLITFCP